MVLNMWEKLNALMKIDMFASKVATRLSRGHILCTRASTTVNMKLPTLYKKSVTGAILEWVIEVESNQHRTHSGQQGGAITVTEWTSCKSKNTGKANATTAEEQAYKDALSKWTKKRDREQFVESLNDLDVVKFVQPMLAQKYVDRCDTPQFVAALKRGDVSVSLKLNGARCVASKHGLFSRKGSEWKSCPHVSEALKPLFDAHPDLVLDGELFNEDMRQDLGSIISLISKKKPTASEIEQSKQLVKYHVYDIVDVNTRYYDRYEQLQHVVESLKNPVVQIVKDITVHDKHEIDDYLKQFESQGHEGLMVRINDVYENKRSKNLLKHKSFTDDEFLVVGVVEGEGNLTGKIGAFVLEDSRGVRFNSAPTGSHQYWEQMWRDREHLVGKTATVKYKELTPVTERGGGVPSFGKVVSIRDYEG